MSLRNGIEEFRLTQRGPLSTEARYHAITQTHWRKQGGVHQLGGVRDLTRIALVPAGEALQNRRDGRLGGPACR